MIKEFKNGEITVAVPTTEHAYLLMDIAEHQNCIIQKYYWISKWDEDYKVYIEPKIYDAFTMEVILRGDNNDLSNCFKAYKEKKSILDNLPTQPKLSEKEIKEYANKMLSTIL